MTTLADRRLAKLRQLRELYRLRQQREADGQWADARRAWGPCDQPGCDGMPHDGWPNNHARPAQITPPGDWNAWLILAGRGFGKTRTGAEDIAWYMLSHTRSRCAVLAPTYSDARDTCIEGESGLLAVFERYGLRDGEGLTWNRSLGELLLDNGSRAKLFTAEKPDRLRGPQHHRAWVDELAQVVRDAPDAWDMLMFGLRLGEHPQVVATTTPLPVQVVRELVARAEPDAPNGPDVVLTRGSTYDNSANLAPAALAQLRERYEGSRLGRQELYADLLNDVPGALWRREWFDTDRLPAAPAPDMTRVVIGVDPAVSDGETSAETGIIVAGGGRDGHGYVIADYTLRGTPQQVMRRVVQAYHDHHADRVVAEVNNGGDYIGSLLHAVDPGVAYLAVRASRGKHTRAEPVSALYEQHRVHHLGAFPQLEDQLCTWEPTDLESPDRLDALVWAFYDLKDLISGSWLTAYGVTTCAHCRKTFMADVGGVARDRCPHCSAPVKPAAA